MFYTCMWRGWDLSGAWCILGFTHMAKPIWYLWLFHWMSSDLVYMTKAAQPPAGPIELRACLPHGLLFIHRFQTGVTDSSRAHSSLVLSGALLAYNYCLSELLDQLSWTWCSSGVVSPIGWDTEQLKWECLDCHETLVLIVRYLNTLSLL